MISTRMIVLFLLFCLALSLRNEKDGYEVAQIHLAQGKTPHEITVSWVTAASALSQVKYGITPDNLNQSQTGSFTTYTFSYLMNPQYTSGALHTTKLLNLLPNTKYFYQCGDFSRDTGTSGISTFTTLPEVGDKQKLVFGVLGDLGQTSDSGATLGHLEMNHDISMILHVGDLSYANCDQVKWDTYGVLVEPLAKEMPWMVGGGNHEIELYDKNGSNVYTAFEARYAMPGDFPAQLGPITYNPYASCMPSAFQSEYNYGNSFYSFESGSVHVINLNPYSTSNTTSVQYKWLQGDLQGVDRSVTPWVVVMMHCPWYNSNKDHHDEWQTTEMKSYMEQLFYDYHVNVVFAGHVHAYERTTPVFVNDTVALGVTYINIGDGGNAEGHAINYYTPSPSWSAFRNGTQYGHGVLTAVSPTELQWQWNRNVDGEQVTMDRITICNTALGARADCAQA